MNNNTKKLWMLYGCYNNGIVINFRFFFPLDDKCAGANCPDGQTCYLADNGNGYECTDGREQG